MKDFTSSVIFSAFVSSSKTFEKLNLTTEKLKKELNRFWIRDLVNILLNCARGEVALNLNGLFKLVNLGEEICRMILTCNFAVCQDDKIGTNS